MRKSMIMGLLIAGLGIMMVSSVTAQSTDDPISASNDTSVTGGEVQQQDLQITTETNDWSGLFGQITSGKKLESSGGTFFEWSAADPGSMKYVYAVASGTDAPDSNVVSTSNPGNLISSDGGVDSADNTFSQSLTFDGLGKSISTSAVETFDSSGSKAWATFLLDDGSGNPVYAAEAVASGDGFNGNSVDYQMLLPDQDSGGSTYDFYVELE
jgi:hypothetical protein